MFPLTHKPDMGARLYAGLIRMATTPGRGTNITQLIQHVAGVLVETYTVFDKPDEAMTTSLNQLSKLLNIQNTDFCLNGNALPPAHIMDFETERGREAARELFEDWMDCAYEFHGLMLTIIHNIVVSWEEQGQDRAITFVLLRECVVACMRNEFAAQELCDVVIDNKATRNKWTLGDCIAALSATAGHYLTQAISEMDTRVFPAQELPDMLDQVSNVMTREAARLGVPVGANWRFGLPANDVPVVAPHDLVAQISPYCSDLFFAMNCACPYEMAVACAKAAGRMVAVAAGGETPEIEPVIAKPLAMAAMSDTYKSLCIARNIASC